MEKRAIPRWKNASGLRKAQIIAGATGAFVTITSWIPIGRSFGKYSPVGDFLSQVGFVLLIPTFAIWKAAGMEGAAVGQILFVGFETAINAFLCIAVATLIGVVLREITEPLRRSRP